MKDNISIEWESTGYSVLKNLNASVLGIFCEFIDKDVDEVDLLYIFRLR